MEFNGFSWCFSPIRRSNYQRLAFSRASRISLSLGPSLPCAWCAGNSHGWITGTTGIWGKKCPAENWERNLSIFVHSKKVIYVILPLHKTCNRKTLTLHLLLKSLQCVAQDSPESQCSTLIQEAGPAPVLPEPTSQPSHGNLGIGRVFTKGTQT